MMPAPPDPEQVFSRCVSEAVRDAPHGATLIAGDLVRAGERVSGPLLPQRSRQIVIGILRDAEQAAMGRLVVGRRGKPTRFLKQTGPSPVHPRDQAAPLSHDPRGLWLDVPFSLASGMMCVLRLPVGLSVEDRAELRSRVVGYLGAEG